MLGAAAAATAAASLSPLACLQMTFRTVSPHFRRRFVLPE